MLHPCKGGHRIVARNGSADLTTKGVENAAARGVFDDELDQGRGRLGKASGGFDEEDGKVLGVIHEVAEDGPVPGPLGRGPERKGPREPGDRERVAVGVPDAAQGIGRGGGIAAGDVDVLPVGGGDEPAVGAGLSRIAGEGPACAEVLHGLPGGGPKGGVVGGGFIPERWETGIVGGRENEGLLGKDGEDGGVRGGDGVEQVDGGVADGIVAVNVEELTG